MSWLSSWLINGSQSIKSFLLAGFWNSLGLISFFVFLEMKWQKSFDFMDCCELTVTDFVAFYGPECGNLKSEIYWISINFFLELAQNVSATFKQTKSITDKSLIKPRGNISIKINKIFFLYWIDKCMIKKIFKAPVRRMTSLQA